MPNRPTPLDVRFWRKVRQAPGNACWLWTGALDHRGYGDYRKHTPERKAHRLAWHVVNGPIPAGLFVLHTCDNPPCVRPDHLFLGTHVDNMRDSAAKGRNASQRYPGLRAGARAGNAKLTQANVQEIRSSTSSHTDLAHQFGICAEHVRRIRRGQRWRAESVELLG